VHGDDRNHRRSFLGFTGLFSRQYRPALRKTVVNKIADIQKLEPQDKAHVLALLDAFLQSHKARNVFAQ
jgi:hypothetical protein